MSRMAGVEGFGGQCWGAAGAILRRSRDTQSCLDGVGTIACRSVRSISWSTTGSKLLGPVLPVTSWQPSPTGWEGRRLGDRHQWHCRYPLMFR
jgi:hypothetical protein